MPRRVRGLRALLRRGHRLQYGVPGIDVLERWGGMKWQCCGKQGISSDNCGPDSVAAAEKNLAELSVM